MRWRSRLAALLLTAGALAPAGAQRAQEMPASLIADQVTYDRETRILVASGNVEVLYQGRVLRADRIVYDEGKDEIRAARQEIRAVFFEGGLGRRHVILVALGVANIDAGDPVSLGHGLLPFSAKARRNLSDSLAVL